MKETWVPMVTSNPSDTQPNITDAPSSNAWSVPPAKKETICNNKNTEFPHPLTPLKLACLQKREHVKTTFHLRGIVFGGVILFVSCKALMEDWQSRSLSFLRLQCSHAPSFPPKKRTVLSLKCLSPRGRHPAELEVAHTICCCQVF